MTSKITTCLWFDGQAEEAANFYQATFPDSHVHGVFRAPADYPERQERRRSDGRLHRPWPAVHGP